MKTQNPWSDSTPEPEAEPVIPWTREQVQALEQRQSSLSPWVVVRIQAAVAAVLVSVWGLLGSEPARQVSSTLWGAASVVLPHALMAWGLRRRAETASGALLRFFLWELAKLGLALVILVAAVWLARPLSWPALLVALVACLKVHVWALWWLTRSSDRKH